MGPATLVSILREYDPRTAWDLVRQGRLRRPPRVRGGRPEQGETLFGPGGDQLDGTAAAVAGGKAGGTAGVLGLPAADCKAGGVAGDRSWEAAALRIDTAASWDRARADGVRVTWFGRHDYPEALVHDPNPPGVLFWRGSLACLARPRVAIVGTRNATPNGRAIAFEMARDLTLAGVCVVSGLALGIDGAAHHGALEGLVRGPAAAHADPSPGPPLGVAASGVDVPYPRQHTGLWERVCRAGAIVSETPPGQPAQAWRFPSRNRIIAGLSLMVVVVESHMAGGSLITAEAALERGVEVRAVPGPVGSPASEGSNQLLYDGPGPVRSAQDVLDTLGVILPRDHPSEERGDRSTPAGKPPRTVLSSLERAVVDCVGWRPSSLGQIVDRSGLAVSDVAAVLDRLEARGVLVREGSWWVRVLASRTC